MDPWKKAQSSCKAKSLNRWEGVSRWKQPQQGWTSCTVDATISTEGKVSSFGCVLRDERDEFMAGYGGNYLGDFPPKIVEAMAFREALSWVKGKGMTIVIFELDSLLVVQAITRKRRDCSYFGDIIEDCSKNFKDLRSLSVQFVKDLANMAAHRVATREVISLSGHREWNIVPSLLSNVIAYDLD